MSDRVSIRYHSDDDPTPVTLAAFVEARPSTVKPGDVFTVPERSAAIMLRTLEDGTPVDPRWQKAPAVADTDQYPDLTVAQMHERAAAIADEHQLDAPEQPRTRAESAAILADLELRYPPVPEQPDGEPAVGDQPSAAAEGDTSSDEDNAR